MNKITEYLKEREEEFNNSFTTEITDISGLKRRVMLRADTEVVNNFNRTTLTTCLQMIEDDIVKIHKDNYSHFTRNVTECDEFRNKILKLFRSLEENIISYESTK